MLKNYFSLPRPVLILCLGTLINRAGSMVIPFLTLYLKEGLELTTAFATLSVSAYGVGSFVASAIGGHLADRIGRKTVMLGSMFGGGTILLVFAHLHAPWAILSATLAFALVMEMYRPAASAMIADLVGTDHRTYAFGLMYVAINLGFAIAPILAGVLIEIFSFQSLFRVDAATSMAYGLLILFTIAETLPTRRGRAEHDAPRTAGEPVTRETITAGASEEMDWFAALKHMIHDRPFVLFCLATLCCTGAYAQAFTTFPLQLAEYDIGSTTYGRIIAVNGIMIVILQLPISSVITRFRRSKMIVIGAMLTAIGFGMIGVVTSVPLFVMTVAIWTLGEMLLAPLSNAIVSDLAPVHLRGRYMGAITMCWSVGMAFVFLGGLILQRMGGGVLWSLAFGLGMMAALLFGVMGRHIDKPHQADPT